MGSKKHRKWTSAEGASLNRYYGRIPIDQVCAALKATRAEVYNKARHQRVTRRSKCKICGKDFLGQLRKESYCSAKCRRVGNTASHSIYVANNRAHIREYSRARKLRIWGASSKEIAHRAEEFAIERILPRLGFSDIFHASKVRRFVPFDIVATYRGNRVLIDVTTSVTKAIGLNNQKLFADALRMPIYALVVKPDLSKHQLTLCDGSKTFAMHVSELVAVE